MSTSTSTPALFRTRTCVIAACSRCYGEPDNEDRGFTPHFDSPGQARQELTDPDGYKWRIVTGPDGQEELLCPRCADKDDCDRLGHDPYTSPAARMPDGSISGASTWCDRCGHLLSYKPGEPAPPGYPVPAPDMLTVRWDAAALPTGEDIARAAARVLARLADDAVAARWDTWDGDQARRPAPDAYTRDHDRNADRNAALILLTAARQLLGECGDHEE